MTSSLTREVERIVRGYPTEDGGGVKLVRVLDPRQAHLYDPFLLFDEFRSDDAADYLAGFPPHPHRGFETVTYMLAGHMYHRDNQGNTGHLGPGAVQWMTAARGIIHEERPQQESGLMWGYQLWVNLPAREKLSEPAYQDIPAERIPEVTLPEGGRVRVIAGEYGGVRGPVRPRPSEPLYLDVQLPAGAEFRITPPAGHTVLVHGVEGTVELGAKRTPLAARQLAMLGRAGEVVIAARPASGRVLLIAGKPFGEPIAHYGPFVMNTAEELRQAIADYSAGRF
ncbi:MAG TPA: pirin family protein [Gammaproteobacteria bacterium]|nr:pirin family protein [Gammaproteobacteria bacterium]